MAGSIGVALSIQNSAAIHWSMEKLTPPTSSAKAVA